MDLSVKFKIYAFFAFAAAFGVFLCIWLFAAFGIESTIGFTAKAGIAAGIYGMFLFYLNSFKAEILMVISGFTIFAPAFCTAMTVLYGFYCGDYCIRYYISENGQLPFIAAILLSIVVIAINVYISAFASAHRAHLKSAAPKVSEFVHSAPTKQFFECALTCAVIQFAVSCAMYFLLIYFPVK